MALPKAQEAPTDVLTIYNDNIKQVLAEYMDNFNIDDLRSIKPLQFNSLLKYIHNKIFVQNDRDILKDEYHDATYDLDKVFIVSNIYIDLCETTVHSCSLYGLSCITGISYLTIRKWSELEDDGRKATEQRISITKNIKAIREQHEANRLEGSTVGDIAILNHEYSWNNPIQRSEEHKRAVTLDDIPRLSDGST